MLFLLKQTTILGREISREARERERIVNNPAIQQSIENT